MGLRHWLIRALGGAVGTPGDWMDKGAGPAAAKSKPAARFQNPSEYYDADADFEALAVSVLNPVLEADKDVAAGKATVREAWLFEGIFDENGHLVRDRAILESRRAAKPYRLRRYAGAEFVVAQESAKTTFEALPAKAKNARESAAAVRLERRRVAREANSKESFDDGFFDSQPTQYDPLQYTEYTPTYGGPFAKQLYLTDYLTMHARSFEAWNHNPLAKRIVKIPVEYAMSRGFKVKCKDEATQKKWEAFDAKWNVAKKLPGWLRERRIYGELMLDKKTWKSIDPSTVWDIITNPDDVDDVYYYHQQYSTAYQQFTGKKVPGVPGAADQKATEYIIRQLPYDQVIHIKSPDSVSNEKRGRSVLFPILGWLKRIKDLYNAAVIRAQLEASFIFDDTIDGSAADVAAHAAAYSSMPLPGSVFAHNKAVERESMPAVTGTATNQGDIGDRILAFIATAVGIPKEYLNVSSYGGGSRAGALMSSEPFTKVVEEEQVTAERILHSIAAEGAGIPEDAIEFIFPSVAKDTTTETIKNLQAAESAAYISKETAATMAASELNITTYDFEAELKKIREEQEAGLQALVAMPPPAGRFGGPGADPEDGDGESDLRGDGKEQLKKDLVNR